MTNRSTKGKLTVGALNVQGTAVMNDFQSVQITWADPSEEAANEINIVATVTDGNGNAVTEPYSFRWWLADNAYGQGLATAPNTSVDINSEGYMIELISNRTGYIMTEDNGTFSFELKHTAAGTWYVVIALPNAKLSISPAMTFTA